MGVGVWMDEWMGAYAVVVDDLGDDGDFARAGAGVEEDDWGE